jgi:hypothetical protein
MANTKQAVLMIHGIGNQRPMQTLRSFVDTVWTDHKTIHNKYAGSHVWSKPDNVSNNFELRRLSTPRNAADITTDFYEFYWAHLMHGTGYGHLFSWLFSLLWRKPGSVPSGLKSTFYLLWTIFFAVISGWGLVIGDGVIYEQGEELLERVPVWVAVILTICTMVTFGFLSFMMKEVIGDAARYLRPSAQNIQRRHEVRTAGVDLLKQLHERGYDRIIIVGHSLGSVIGYDILTYAFPDYNVPKEPKRVNHTAHDALEKIMQAASEGKATNIDEAQRAQRSYFNEFTDSDTLNGQWRVTDFITLGSPLAHASVLLAHDSESLEHKAKTREYPCCFPVLEQKIRTTDPSNRHFSYTLKPNKTNGQAIKIPHHAALFALTRWSNIYFPCKAIVWGDLIGGPIPEILGKYVLNRPVGTNIRKGFLTHLCYWKPSKWKPKPGDARQQAVKALREALDLLDRNSASAK